jgi:hypothetical protein
MAPRKTAPKTKSTKAAKVVYDPALLAVSQAGLVAEDKENDEFLVEDLLSKRIHNGQTQYLVSWQGDWTGPFDSLTGKEKWENADDIEDSLIDQYEREAANSARLSVEMAHTAWARARDRSEAAERSNISPDHRFRGKLVRWREAASKPSGVVKGKAKSKPVSKAKAKAKAERAEVKGLFDLEAEEAASDEGSEEEEEEEKTEAEAEVEGEIKAESESEVEVTAEPESESEDEAKAKLAAVPEFKTEVEAEVQATAGAQADLVWRPENDPNYDSLDDAEEASDDEL